MRKYEGKGKPVLKTNKRNETDLAEVTPKKIVVFKGSGQKGLHIYRVVVFNATFNNISVISRQLVLLVEENPK